MPSVSVFLTISKIDTYHSMLSNFECHIRPRYATPQTPSAFCILHSAFRILHSVYVYVRYTYIRVVRARFHLCGRDPAGPDTEYTRSAAIAPVGSPAAAAQQSNRSLNCLLFNPNAPVVAVGTDKGQVIIFRLFNVEDRERNKEKQTERLRNAMRDNIMRKGR